METEKLYYEDPYCTAFTGRVLSCEKSKAGWSVVLDRTAFYPEGGGQPADRGTLGGVRVTDVQEQDGVILHTCDGPVEPGADAEGSVDWARRFDHMQQHSGEHILSGLLCALYDCSNVGFHLGADTVTIDYDRVLTEEQVLEAERRANAVIWRDTPAEITFPSHEELERLHYRSKKELTGQVRIVAFPGADCCACCGTHVRSAGQVGLVKLLTCQKFRDGVRIEMAAGGRALRPDAGVVYRHRHPQLPAGHPHRRPEPGGRGRRLSRGVPVPGRERRTPYAGVYSDGQPPERGEHQRPAHPLSGGAGTAQDTYEQRWYQYSHRKCVPPLPRQALPARIRPCRS